MHKISVVIITLNEEKNIQSCLDSVDAIADEIVVVDSFSTDNTQEICRHNEKVRFFQNKFEGYIEQRNWAIKMATHHHILAIDADEMLSDQLKKSIKELKNDWTHDCYSFNRLNNFCGKWIKHCGWYPDVKLRLFDSRRGKFGGINPHDKLQMEPNATCKHIKGDLLHFSYTTITEHVLQQIKFSDIKSQSLYNKGTRIYSFKIFSSPIVSFIKNFILKRGFLDGFYGFVICMNTSYYSFLTYAKLWDMHKHKKRKK
jgi:glycosyltransferase involved in cell wall biosynthesis